MNRPLCFWKKQIFCFDSCSSYMGNMQDIHGNSYSLSCVFPRSWYISNVFSIVTVQTLIFILYCLYSFLHLAPSLTLMALLNWIPPPVGTLKVNVHASAFHQPMPNGNTNGIWVVLRTSDGNLVNCIDGTIPGLTPLGAQLWSVQIGLRRTFVEGAKSVIIETDNIQAFGAVQFAHLHQHLEYDDLIHQIVTRIRDPNWDCSFRFVYSVRNLQLLMHLCLEVSFFVGCISFTSLLAVCLSSCTWIWDWDHKHHNFWRLQWLMKNGRPLMILWLMVQEFWPRLSWLI